jgi:hypothetical protein
MKPIRLVILVVALGFGIAAGVSQFRADSQVCGQTVARGKICGDKLLAFCKAQYDPVANGIPCGKEFKKAGIDPKKVLAKLDPTGLIAASRGDGQQAMIGKPIDLGDTSYVIHDVSVVDAIHPAGGGAPVIAKPGAKLVRITLTYRNDTSTPATPLCRLASGYQLEAVNERKYDLDPVKTAIDPANKDSCSALAPGAERGGAAIIQVARSANPVALVQWASSALDPLPAEKYFVYVL